MFSLFLPKTKLSLSTITQTAFVLQNCQRSFYLFIWKFRDKPHLTFFSNTTTLMWSEQHLFVWFVTKYFETKVRPLFQETVGGGGDALWNSIYHRNCTNLLFRPKKFVKNQPLKKWKIFLFTIQITKFYFFCRYEIYKLFFLYQSNV